MFTGGDSRWGEQNDDGFNLENYQFENIIIPAREGMILIPSGPGGLTTADFTVQIPKKVYVVGERKGKRYNCRKVTADLMQRGFLARGDLLDFSPRGIRIIVKPISPSSFHWFDAENQVIVHLRNERQTLFSGTCNCIRAEDQGELKEIVLAPADKPVNILEKRRSRNPRQKLAPAPSLIFEHPFTGKRVQLEVDDISSSGFTVYEKPGEGLLMLEMIIPRLTVDFSGTTMIECSAQVVYRGLKDEKRIRCGLAVLDMNLQAYTSLTQLLTKALDSHAYISNRVEMESLWEFLFETGFVYPDKYKIIGPYRREFEKTYRNLYEGSPELARHFTYQKNGRIYGHIAMLRSYQKCWMIHHYAARSMDKKRPGFKVLNQIMYFLNDMYRLPSARMDYVMSYFRPTSKFPNRVFGGFAGYLDNREGCSMDLFSYVPYPSLSIRAPLPEGWSLLPCSKADLWKVARFYEHYSGGLLLEATGFGHANANSESLEQMYAKAGFYREWNTYSLNYYGEQYAVIMADQSDLGMNFSELLNGIKVLVTKPQELSWEILSIAIWQLTRSYQMDKIPVMIYPQEYVDAKRIPYEKQYCWWILSVKYADEFMEFMREKYKMQF